jgi:hypothetical protein
LFYDSYWVHGDEKVMPTTTATSFELPFYSVSFGVLGIGTITLVWFLVRDWSNKKERLRRRRKFAALVMNGNANSAQEKEGGDSRLVDSGTRRETGAFRLFSFFFTLY